MTSSKFYSNEIFTYEYRLYGQKHWRTQKARGIYAMQEHLGDGWRNYQVRIKGSKIKVTLRGNNS